MAYNKIVYDGTTLIDLTSDTVSDASHIVSGYVGHLRDGTQVTGTGSGGGGTYQQILGGTSAPTASDGNDGDIWLLESSGGTYTGYPASYTSSNMNNSSNCSACIGTSADGGSATSNVYSSGSSVTGVVEYTFDSMSDIPSTATISSVTCVVKAHEENSSRSSFTLQLYSGSTAKGSATTVDGTSNATYTLTTGSWTRSELDDLVLHCSYGYYGGNVAGATLTISYSMTSASADVTLTVSENGWQIAGSNIYQKTSGSWSTVSSATLDTTVTKA